MINTNDLQQEEERLDLVKERLRSKIAEQEPEVTGLRDQVVDIRKRFWEEVTVNTSSYEDFADTFYSIKQQERILSERERSHRLWVERYKSMKRLLPSPYFGRIDYQEDGSGLIEPVYIGVSSFLDRDGLSFLVYDWRTPIASMYYDCSPGVSSYETPVGQITGRMTLKRQYQIRDGQLQNVFDTSITIGDELLQQVLGKGADTQMKSIVATIQKEQNAIIRNDKSRMLIVQGVAGSGKTSAALQRVAYLLYKHRDRLKADQIVLFSPNPMFNSYVSTVLPELGEENMQQTTFQEYLEHWLGSTFQLENPFEQIEYILQSNFSPAYEARLIGIKYKASEAFLQAMQNYALWLGEEGMLFRGICFRDRDLISAEQMKSQFYSYDSSIRLVNRVAQLQEWLLRELTSLEHQEREALWVQDELDYLDNEEYAEVYSQLLKKSQGEENVFDFTMQQEELLRRMIVKEYFRPLRREAKRFLFIDMIGLYDQLFGEKAAYQTMTNETEMPDRWAEICRQTKEKLGRLELFYEDATPFLYLKELIEGTRTNTDVRHLFIDEGQDYSPFQYVFLKQLFPRARMTVLGDFSQAIFPQATNLHEADSSLIRLYGEADTSLIRLVRSYRSTREIVEFTKSLLPSEEIVPFERSGGKPHLFEADSDEKRAARIVEDLAALKAEGFDTIAVITKTAAESLEAYKALTTAGCKALRLITKETLTFEKGTLVIPAYLAKGVEFDAVLIYDASSRTYQRESERKLFYTACTRAMHRLLLYTTGEWTPYIRALDTSLYEVGQ
ncbi:RNA polymerase recycling motor HelD [Paenibacillus wynnii]|uniref:RNA polymerase recycling motor HelD n=1 Tax=Paenibacillus wynnii TaxID=268407 RepID=UPI002791A54E|nr:RNA polymerase recycling motor HelD [Paenibacillus wynnii]MDQ0193576.1 DNA helicase-2/ATP-dependent DNA helicase PcrA [Paenibacillus wynnii]